MPKIVVIHFLYHIKKCVDFRIIASIVKVFQMNKSQFNMHRILFLTWSGLILTFLLDLDSILLSMDLN